MTSAYGLKQHWPPVVKALHYALNLLLNTAESNCRERHKTRRYMCC